MHREQISGLILAGGDSRRFGSPKANYPIHGRRMIDHVLEAVRPLVDDVRISVRSERDAPEGIDEDIVVDRFACRGPLAGLHAGLLAAGSSWLLVTACDVPFVTTSDLERLTAARGKDAPAVVAVSSEGRRHPLCACYHRSLLPLIERRLASDDVSMRGLLDAVQVVEVLLPDRALLNVNSPSDLAS